MHWPLRWPLQRWTRRLQAPLLFESFLIAAVCSFLGIRALLAVLGYPELGGSGLHIAHMLWGGLLMLVALLLLFGFLDYRVQQIGAVVAGLGFGTFIDEIGKFVTADNDYFFRPSIALIYVVFVGAFLLAKAFVGNMQLNPRESLANALDRLELESDQPIEPDDRAIIDRLLQGADPRSPLVRFLGAYVDKLPTRPDTDSPIEIIDSGLEAAYSSLTARTWFLRALTAGVVVYTVAAIIGIFAVITTEGRLDISALPIPTLAQAVSTLAGAALVLIGVPRLATSLVAAYQWFMRGLLVWILVTQVFIFYSSQLAGLGGLAVDLIAYGALRFAIQRERHTAPSSVAKNR
jgi:hypothetical protein